MIKEHEELNSNNFDVVADEIVADGAVLLLLRLEQVENRIEYLKGSVAFLDNAIQINTEAKNMELLEKCKAMKEEIEATLVEVEKEHKVLKQQEDMLFKDVEEEIAVLADMEIAATNDPYGTFGMN